MFELIERLLKAATIRETGDIFVAVRKSELQAILDMLPREHDYLF